MKGNSRFLVSTLLDLTLSSGSNFLLVVVDRLTKFFTFLPCAFGPDHPFGAGDAADLLVYHIVGILCFGP